MKKLFSLLTFVLFTTAFAAAQERGGNAARDRGCFRDRSTIDRTNCRDRADRTPAMGRADQRGSVSSAMREHYREMNEAEKAKDRTMERAFPARETPSPAPSSAPQERHERLGKNS